MTTRTALLISGLCALALAALACSALVWSLYS